MRRHWMPRGWYICRPDCFCQIFAPMKEQVDWSSNGPFRTAGGQKGAVAVYQTMKRVMDL